LFILVNYLSLRHFMTFDLTNTREFTLSDKTVNILHSLEYPVAVSVFGNPEPYVETYLRRLLALYERHSRGQFDYQFVNPDFESDRAKALLLRDEFELTVPENVILLRVGERRATMLVDELYELTQPDYFTGSPRRIKSWFAEEKISSKIVELLSDKKRVAYFLEGHGEGNWRNKNSPRDLGEAAARIERDFFEIRGLSLLLKGVVPEDADIVLIVGPLTPLQPMEISALEAYLSRRGKILIALDWDSESGLEQFLAQRGCVVRPEKILGRLSKIIGGVEVRQFGSTVPLLEQDFANHPILRSLRHQTLLMPNLRALELKDALLPGWRASYLLRTPASFWGESGEWNENTQFDEGEDLSGPVTVASVLENDNGAKILVFAGCLSFDNQNIYLQPGAADLWSNSINWLTARESLLGIGPRQASEFRLKLDSFQLTLLFVIVVGLIPVIILSWGIIVWLERRS